MEAAIIENCSHYCIDHEHKLGMYSTCYFKLKFHDISSYYAISKFLYHLYQCFVVVVTVCMQIKCHTLQN
jgi:hypothetical protein